MRLTEKHVLEFQRLYKEVYKEELSREEATRQCMDMVILGQIIYSPFAENELKALEQLKEY